MSRRRHPLHNTPIHAHTAERKQTEKKKPLPNPNNGSFHEIFSTVNRSGEGEEWVEGKEQGRCKTHKAEAMQQRKFVTAAVWQPPSPSPLSLLSRSVASKRATAGPSEDPVVLPQSGSTLLTWLHEWMGTWMELDGMLAWKRIGMRIVTWICRCILRASAIWAGNNLGMGQIGGPFQTNNAQ
jgi:hypothetical protein